MFVFVEQLRNVGRLPPHLKVNLIARDGVADDVSFVGVLEAGAARSREDPVLVFAHDAALCR